MPDYLELYKLELGEEPYSVQRIIDTEQQSSPECQLPELTALTLTLPELPTLPDLTCEFDIEVPLVPLPYVCPPTVSGGITLRGCDGSTVIGTAGITRAPNTCDYVLDGDINVCLDVPCSSGYDFSSDVEIIGGGELVTLTGALELTTVTCGAILSGTLEITENLELVCTTGYTVDLIDATVTPQTIDLGNGVTIDVDVSLQIEDTNTDKCNSTKSLMLELSGTLSGASWVEVLMCDSSGNATVTKRVLMID